MGYGRKCTTKKQNHSVRATCPNLSAIPNLALAPEFLSRAEGPLGYSFSVPGDTTKPLDYRALGLLIIATILLGVILLRWGSHLAWGAR